MRNALMKSEYQAIWTTAYTAGMAAAAAITPQPIAAVQTDLYGNPIQGARVHILNDGACGFAWVSFAGNTAFGRWAKSTGLARKAYGGGLQIWVHEFGQSMTRKEAFARAAAATLRECGIDAHSGSRMD
jgi:hypothetical protein